MPPLVNPTFVYSLNGVAFAVHSAMLPARPFHLLLVLTAREVSAYAVVDLMPDVRRQLDAWRTAFRHVAGPSANSLILRFCVVGALSFPHALTAREADPSIPPAFFFNHWSTRALGLDGAVGPAGVAFIAALGLRTPEAFDLLRSGVGMPISTRDSEAHAWQYLLSAFVKRARTWRHGPDCAYAAAGEHILPSSNHHHEHYRAQSPHDLVGISWNPCVDHTHSHYLADQEDQDHHESSEPHLHLPPLPRPR
jgi:hypothetical protein